MSIGASTSPMLSRSKICLTNQQFSQFLGWQPQDSLPGRSPGMPQAPWRLSPALRRRALELQTAKVFERFGTRTWRLLVAGQMVVKGHELKLFFWYATVYQVRGIYTFGIEGS